ncbi:MAG: response regulator [Thermodesulfobacteriota bacterium]
MTMQAAKPKEPVLVVEDTPDSREVLGTLLESEGYRVAYAVDGRDALDQLERGLRPCLIVLDVAMPRMNGIEFRRAQSADPRFSDIPVILYSAVHEITWLYPSLDLPIVRKPVDVDHILEMVERSRRRLEATPPA